MSDTNKLQEMGTGLVLKIIEAIDAGIDKAPEVFSDLAKEYATYFVIQEFPLGPIFGLVIGVGALFPIYKISKNLSEDSEGMSWIIFVSAVFVVAVMGAATFSGLKSVYQSYAAPKAFLIEQLRKPPTCRDTSP